MRIACLVLLTLAGPTRAADDPPTLRARAALALAGDGRCGRCREDGPEVRGESLRTGRPVVLFVGGCEGKAKDLPPGAIPARCRSYQGDGDPDPARTRAVVLTPAAGGEFRVNGVLPADAGAEAVRSAVAAAAPAAVRAARADWAGLVGAR